MNKAPIIKGLIFDKDGTLFDFSATWGAWAKAFLLRLGAGDNARVKTLSDVIGFDLDSETFARDSIVIANTSGEIVEALQPHFPEMSAIELIQLLNDEAQDAPQSEAVPLLPLLTLLRDRGLKLGVATNDAERPARAHLAQAGITEMFDFIVGFDSGHGGKPAPGQLLAFADHTVLACHEVVMIGDSTHDLDAGRAAGMLTIGVLTGLATEDDLRPFADVILPDIGHLPAWLDQQSAE